MACVYVYVIIMTFLGPENKGRDMTVAHDHDLEEAAGRGAVANVAHQRQGSSRHSGSDEEKTDKM